VDRVDRVDRVDGTLGPLIEVGALVDAGPLVT